MNRKLILWIIIGVLALFALFLMLKIGISGSSIQGVSEAAKTAATSSNAMVGGC